MQMHRFPIESLPAELFLEIINYALLLCNDKESMLNLCLVSRRFRDVVCPSLFFRINLGGFTSRLRDKSTQLKALSKGNTKASALAKHLSIDYSSSFSIDPAKVLTPLEETMLKYLRSAIGSFRAITSMSLQISLCEPPWVIDSIINSLATLPTLKDICITLTTQGCPIGERLNAFSNLHKIRVRTTHLFSDDGDRLGKVLANCPALTDLDISAHTNMPQLFQFVNQTGKSLSLRNLSMDQVLVSRDYFKSAVRHLRSLQSLSLYRYSTSDSGPTIWDILVKERIYIRNLATDIIDDSLFLYLSSFQGLRKFSSVPTFNIHIFISTEQSLPVDILQAMIPHHAESLAELDILITNDQLSSNMPFSNNLVSLLSSFNNLRSFALQLQVIPFYPQIITCAKIFPKLERLVLHTPQAYFYLQHPHLEPRFTFPNNFRDAIAEYRFEGPSVPSFEIDCDRIIYKPHKDEKTGTFTYIS